MMNNWKKFLPWIMVALALLTITINSGMSASITSIFDTFLKDTFQIDNKHLHLHIDSSMPWASARSPGVCAQKDEAGLV